MDRKWKHVAIEWRRLRRRGKDPTNIDAAGDGNSRGWRPVAGSGGDTLQSCWSCRHVGGRDLGGR